MTRTAESVGMKRGLFALSWPIFIDLFMHYFTIIINTYMVSMLSLEAVAEMTLGGQTFQFAFTIFNFVNIGICVCSAQALGNGNMSMVRRIVHMSFGLNIICGLIITALFFFGSYRVCDIMNIPEDIYDTSGKYVRLLSLIYLAECINLGCSSVLRAFGRTRDPMYVNISANFLVVFLNYFLLFGNFGAPKLGIYGAAISAIVARTISVFFLLYLLKKHTRLHLFPKFFFVVKAKILRQIFAISLPGAGEHLTWLLQFLFMSSIVGTFGYIAIATHGVYMQMSNLIILFSESIALGTEIIISHYAGAMHLSLAHKQLITSVKVGLLITICTVINIPLWMGDLVFSLFANDEAVFALARPIFYVSVILESGRILNVVIVNALRAVNDANFPLIMGMLSMWGVSVPIGCFCALYLNLGLLGVWIGFCCDECVRGLIMLWRWQSKVWVRKAVKNYRKNFKYRV